MPIDNHEDYIKSREKGLREAEEGFKKYIDFYGPNGHLPKIYGEEIKKYEEIVIDVDDILSEVEFTNDKEKEEYKNKIKAELTPSTIAAIVLGSSMQDEELKQNMSASTTYGNLFHSNQARLTDDFMKSDGRANRFVAVATRGREKALDAIRTYIHDRDDSKIKNSLDTLADFALNEAGNVYASDYVNSNAWGETQKVGVLFGKDIINRKVFGVTVPQEKEIQKIQIEAFEKQMNAMTESDRIKTELIEDFDGLDMFSKRGMIADMLFNAYLSSMAHRNTFNNAAKDTRANMSERTYDASLGKMGLTTDSYIDSEDNTIVDDSLLRSYQYIVMPQIVKEYKVTDFEVMLASEDGVEKLKSLYMDKIIESETFSKIFNAESKEEFIDQIMAADKVVGHGLTSIEGVELPKVADEINARHEDAFKEEMRKFEDKLYDRIGSLDAFKKEAKGMALKSNNPTSVIEYSNDLNVLYVEIKDNADFFSFGTNYYKNAVRELNTFRKKAQEYAERDRELSADELKEYKEHIQKIEKAADDYLEKDTEEDEDKKESMQRLKRIMRASRVTIDNELDVLEKEAEKLKEDEELKKEQAKAKEEQPQAKEEPEKAKEEVKAEQPQAEVKPEQPQAEAKAEPEQAKEEVKAEQPQTEVKAEQPQAKAEAKAEPEQLQAESNEEAPKKENRYYNRLRELEEKGDIKGVVDIMIELNYKEGEKLLDKEAIDGLDQFTKELTGSRGNGIKARLDPEQDFELFTTYVDEIMKYKAEMDIRVGKQLNDTIKKLSRGEIPGAEEYKDDPIACFEIASGIVNQSENAKLAASAATELMAISDNYTDLKLGEQMASDYDLPPTASLGDLIIARGKDLFKKTTLTDMAESKGEQQYYGKIGGEISGKLEKYGLSYENKELVPNKTYKYIDEINEKYHKISDNPVRDAYGDIIENAVFVEANPDAFVKDKKQAHLAKLEKKQEKLDAGIMYITNEAKEKLNELDKLASYKKSQSTEFSAMHDALKSLAALNGDSTLGEVSEALSNLSKTSKAYMKHIDSSKFRGIRGNGRERREFAGEINEFADSNYLDINSFNNNIFDSSKDRRNQINGLKESIETFDERAKERAKERANAPVEEVKEKTEEEKALDAAGQPERRTEFVIDRDNKVFKELLAIEKSKDYRKLVRTLVDLEDKNFRGLLTRDELLGLESYGNDLCGNKYNDGRMDDKKNFNTYLDIQKEFLKFQAEQNVKLGYEIEKKFDEFMKGEIKGAELAKGDPRACLDFAMDSVNKSDLAKLSTAAGAISLRTVSKQRLRGLSKSEIEEYGLYEGARVDDIVKKLSREVVVDAKDVGLNVTEAEKRYYDYLGRGIYGLPHNEYGIKYDEDKGEYVTGTTNKDKNFNDKGWHLREGELARETDGTIIENEVVFEADPIYFFDKKKQKHIEKMEELKDKLENEIESVANKAKGYLEKLDQLASHKKTQSDEFNAMHDAIREVSELNKDSSLDKVSEALVKACKTSDAYMEHIDESAFRGRSTNGQERREQAGEIKEFSSEAFQKINLVNFHYFDNTKDRGLQINEMKASLLESKNKEAALKDDKPIEKADEINEKKAKVQEKDTKRVKIGLKGLKLEEEKHSSIKRSNTIKDKLATKRNNSLDNTDNTIKRSSSVKK